MKAEENIDAVALMRKLRAQVNEELEGKSFEEQRAYLDEQLSVRKKTQGRPLIDRREG